MPPRVNRDRKRPDKPTKPDKPSPPVSPPPVPPVSGDTRKVPTGTIKTAAPSGGIFGVPWERITRYDPRIIETEKATGVPRENMRALVTIESQGNSQAIQRNPQYGDTYGLTQVNPAIWGPLIVKATRALPNVPDLENSAGYNELANALLNPDVAILAAGYLLESLHDEGRTWDQAHSKFFTWTDDWNGTDSVNKTTGAQYARAFRELVKEQGAVVGPVTPSPPVSPPPVPPITPAPQGNVLDLLYGGRPYIVTASYGQLVTWSCPGCYDYFRDYGLDSQHHYAIDVEATAGDGAPLFAPINGTIVCAGTGNGQGAWGTGCAAFPRTNNYNGKPSGAGSGRLEILHEDGARSLIIGHVLSSRVRPGDRVTVGTLIGEQGGMNASHVHLEGRYANGTRIGNPLTMFSGGPMPEQYANPVPVAQPDDEPPYMVARALQATAVRQRANPAAPKILPDLAKGEEFFVQHKVLGTDGSWWVVGRLGGRVKEAHVEFVRSVLE